MKKAGRLILMTIVLALTAANMAYGDDPMDVSICDIQQYNGVSEGDRVRVTGVCTAETGRYGMSVTIISEEGGGPWCSMYVYVVDQDLIAFQGECVTVVGEVSEYYGKTEIYVGSDEPERPTVTTECFPIPEPMYDLTANFTGAIAEKYESCLVRAGCITVTEEANEGNFWNMKIDDGSGPCLAQFSQYWDNPPEGTEYCSMSGILDYSWDQFKIRPRNEEQDLDTTAHAECGYCGGTTPTPTPTSTGSTPTFTPTGDTTPIPCEPDLVLSLNKVSPNCFTAGDQFSLFATITNGDCPAYTVDFYCVLDVIGMYFWAPTWTETFEGMPVVLPSYDSTDVPLLDFSWPSNAGSFSGLFFYCAIFQEGTFEFLDDLEIKEFCYE